MAPRFLAQGELPSEMEKVLGGAGDRCENNASSYGSSS